MRKSVLFVLFSSISLSVLAAGNEKLNFDELLSNYNPGGKLSFNADRGKELWHKENLIEGKVRDCTSCHGKDLTKPGKHVKSGKVIDPLAPSVNKDRLTELEQVNKWFKRNCKWTFGRECTDQEKGDFLKYIVQF